jgi:mono/diheme cytochrome c family protein
MRARVLNGLMVGLAMVMLVGMRLAAQRNPEAAKVKNPVAATPESLMRGQSEYQRLCANCHGSNGKGGPGNDLTPPAPDLTGTEWKFGSTDGELFYTIKNGVGPEFNMGAWGQQGVKDQDIWNIINYMRTLAKK